MDQHMPRQSLDVLAHVARSSKWTILTAVVTLAGLGVLHVSHRVATKQRLEAGMCYGMRAFTSVLTASVATASDPGLLKKHSTYEKYTTASGHTYPRVRTFYKEHQQASELPKDLPLLVSCFSFAKIDVGYVAGLILCYRCSCTAWEEVQRSLLLS